MNTLICILIITGISLDVLGSMEVEGAMLAEIKKMDMFLASLMVMGLQLSFFFGGYFACDLLVRNDIFTYGDITASIIAFVIFVLLGIRFLVKGIRKAFVEELTPLFQKIYERLNEIDAAKFDSLADDAQFGRYFMRLMPGQKTPRDNFKVRLGTDSNVRAKKLANKVYLWRTDYYFRRLLERMGIDASRIDII